MTTSKGPALIVDDEESIRYALKRDLEQIGFEPLAVSNVQEALQAVERQKSFSLAVLDVRMPGMNGLELLRILRPMLPDACIIMLSAVVDSEIAAQAIRFGADNYLTKPWSPEELSRRVQMALERRREGVKRYSSEPTPDTGKAGLGAVTSDLIRQQVTAFERAARQLDSPAQSRPRRRWWPWRRKS
jgi:DNA-binding response OmpR family regulator